MPLAIRTTCHNRPGYARSFTRAPSSSLVTEAHADVERRHAILAIDVEYAEFRVTAQTRTFAAEICLVNGQGKEIFHRYCRPSPLPEAKHWRGGVKYKNLIQASPIAYVAAAVETEIAGKTVIGHGLGDDLTALGIRHPHNLLRDTRGYPKFQRRDGSTHSLKSLVKHWLKRDIQAQGQPHSAREDARAVMELYTTCILTDPSQMLSEQEMLDAYLLGCQEF